MLSSFDLLSLTNAETADLSQHDENPDEKSVLAFEAFEEIITESISFRPDH
jgi:hypothetical protein